MTSWCDLGTGVGSLPLAVARLGLDHVVGIEGSDAALRNGQVRFSHTNYFTTDITESFTLSQADGTPPTFDIISALELLEHIPEEKLDSLFGIMHRMRPKYLMFSIGLQPDPPYHVTLKSMAEWLQRLSEAFPAHAYDDALSQQVFLGARKHPRFQNHYHTNCLPDDRNLVIFAKAQ